VSVVNEQLEKLSPAVVLLSGGLDSSVLLHYVAVSLKHCPIYALSFRYGQRHAKELDMARCQVELVGDAVAEHCVVELDFFAGVAAGDSALVEGGDDVPDLADVAESDRDQPPTYVPNRNMMLLSIAAAFAEARKCPVVFYGAQAQDEYGYWDCSLEFVNRLNRTLELNRRNAVKVEAPFAGFRKADEVRLGVSLGVDFSKTWSCYRGDDSPCGTCPTCVERATAFREAGVEDPLGARSPLR
jgi:7-cyano-7-deazaguanine synthase